tara:strand:- start:909 stop:1136 length:228 start_codon:yes stop_codon:yes gene_type:complete
MKLHNNPIYMKRIISSTPVFLILVFLNTGCLSAEETGDVKRKGVATEEGNPPAKDDIKNPRPTFEKKFESELEAK